MERLIGTVRRECLDRTLFWTTTDLEEKLLDFQHYYNEQRTHAGRQGQAETDNADLVIRHPQVLVETVTMLHGPRFSSHAVFADHTSRFDLVLPETRLTTVLLLHEIGPT